LQTYAKKELMAEMFAAATKGMSAQAKQLARKVAARAQSLPSLAAMKTTKLDGADCAHKDTYTMIHGLGFRVLGLGPQGGGGRVFCCVCVH
jgi:hypothetical protein